MEHYTALIVTTQVFKHGKEDPMQLSDIIPNDLMYDKMRPPKMEGERLNAAEFDSNCNFIILSNNKT